MSGLTLVDNKVAILPLVLGPSALSHLTADISVRLEDSLVVGVSGAFDCAADAVSLTSKRTAGISGGPPDFQAVHQPSEGSSYRGPIS